MEKEFAALGLFLLVSAGVIFGIVIAWRLSGRPARVITVITLTFLYLLLSFLIIKWASAAGWPEGMFVMLVMMVVVPAVLLGLVITFIIVGFEGGRGSGWRAVGMWTSLGIVALIVTALVFNQHLRVIWHQRNLDDPDPEVRLEAVWGLSDTGHEMALPSLITALNDEDPGVRLAAVYGLCNIDDPNGLPAVKEMLTDEASEVRVAAAYVVVPLSRGAPDLIPLLIELLNDHDPGVREAAISGLDVLDPEWRRRLDVPMEFR